MVPGRDYNLVVFWPNSISALNLLSQPARIILPATLCLSGWAIMCGQNLKRTSSAVVWNMGFCEYVVKIVIMSTWLRSVVNAEDFSRGLPDPAVVRGEWQKAPPCWLMMCCPMSPLGNGYWASLFNLDFCLPVILASWEKYWVLSIAHLPHISLKKQATTKRRHKRER